MASISSTNSSTSLGNTSLRGFGGMASGIDRDSIIEQMTLGTTTKINNQKKKVTELGWKQEAYREVSDKILDWADKYASYSSGSNLRDPSAFAKNQITVHGKEESTSFITATGSSSMLNNVSILGVGQLATSTVRRSEVHTTDGIQTSLKDLNEQWKSSKLEGAKITFGYYENDKTGWTNTVDFEFKSSYTYTEGSETKTEKINFVSDSPEDIVKYLNGYLEHSELKIGEKELKNVFKFEIDSTSGQIKLNPLGGDASGVKIRGGSALQGLGYTEGIENGGITLDDFNSKDKQKFEDSYLNTPSALKEMTGQKLTFNYDGSQKAIELITAEEADAIAKETDKTKQMEMMVNNLQKRLNQAFGTDMVNVEAGTDGLVFKTNKGDSTLSIVSSDSGLLTNLGLEYGASNKVNLNGKLTQDALLGDNYSGLTITKPDSDALDLRINGVEITGLTKNSSISDILSKINSTSAAGVKATYVSATGEFMLVSSETGTGREINLDSDLAKALFGQYKKKADGSGEFEKDANGNMVALTEADGKEKGLTSGQNAKIYVSYGDGQPVLLDRASNTFNLEGLNVTISGTFGLKDGVNVETDKITAESFDTSRSVTFTAKADVDGAVEKVKSFFEEFNEIVTMVSGHVRTRPDSNYGALTDEQKAEMDETSIENWEKKAKQGILYGDSAMQDLSGALEGIFTKLMQNGASYDDLKEIGITYSEDYLDGGTLVFDEAKFRDAMESNPEKVSNIFTGGGSVRKGLVDVIDETFTPYATKYASKNGGDSYGRLIDIAGSEKKPITLNSNEIYKQLKEMQETIEKLQQQLQVEQDRYISQFTTMETLLNQMNTQQSYLSQLTG